MSANEKKGGQEKKAGKPSGAGKRAVKFPRYHDNTRLHKAARMLRSNGFNEAVRNVSGSTVLPIVAVREVIARAKKVSSNFPKWCDRRKIPVQFR
ncbi:MAG: hypothetical protein AAB824_01605 [Patescibacteria group bacterium]